ncbi:hypothetical protein CSUI_004319 [Cystoisospora suis]|uniref:Uncharacterized protein n=1 Tax=Cystoisospora suis TaxID=483139 RepID=A0A2C6L1L8_9APIC|nr:hypothetical protein CSUI_004319 [Cystoisospora suis]
MLAQLFSIPLSVLSSLPSYSLFSSHPTVWTRRWRDACWVFECLLLWFRDFKQQAHYQFMALHDELKENSTRGYATIFSAISVLVLTKIILWWIGLGSQPSVSVDNSHLFIERRRSVGPDEKTASSERALTEGEKGVGTSSVSLSSSTASPSSVSTASPASSRHRSTTLPSITEKEHLVSLSGPPHPSSVQVPHQRDGRSSHRSRKIDEVLPSNVPTKLSSSTREGRGDTRVRSLAKKEKDRGSCQARSRSISSSSSSSSQQQRRRKRSPSVARKPRISSQTRPSSSSSSSGRPKKSPLPMKEVVKSEREKGTETATADGVKVITKWLREEGQLLSQRNRIKFLFYYVGFSVTSRTRELDVLGLRLRHHHEAYRLPSLIFS